MAGAKSINAVIEDDIINDRLDEPTARTIAYYLERSDYTVLNALLWQLFYATLRAKRLDGLRGPNNRLTLALDGVYLPSSTNRHCDKCLNKTIDGVEHFYHAFLVASIVDKDEKFSMPVAIIPLVNTKGADKQDCELNAAHRLLDFLRSKNPHAKFNLSTDGLYLSAEFIAEAVERGHSVTMPLAKENMIIWQVLDVRLGNSQNTFEVKEEQADVTIWWDDRNVAEFWAALQKRNPDIQLFGLKRKIVSTDGREVRECIVVSTLRPINKPIARTISNLQRAKWQEENKTFNVLKNIIGIKHIYNHRASTQGFQFASLALNLRSVFMLRYRPQQDIKKPLTETSLMKALLNLCPRPSDLLAIIKIEIS